MERALYDRFAEVEDRHWWFVAHRRIMAKVIRLLGLPVKARILDAGCGNGGQLQMLSAFGEVYASEMDQEARERAIEKNIAQVVHHEALPERCSFKDEFFDLIALFDVLEHIEDDRKALEVLRAKLKPGGKLLVSVPAFMFLWSPHDVANHHYRRYTRSQLLAIIKNAGYRALYSSYFNIFLFPIAVLMRYFKRLKGDAGHDLAMPSAGVNRLLTAVFGSEALLVPRLSLPFGVSLLAVATKD